MVHLPLGENILHTHFFHTQMEKLDLGKNAVKL